MSEEMSPRDVLISIGYNLPLHRKGFRCGEDGLHTFMYIRKTRFPEVFRRFMFDTNGHYPVCNDLRDAMNSLKLSCVLHSPPIGPGYYQFDPCVSGCYEQVRSKINEGQARDLVVIAQEFDREFGEDNRFRL